MTFEIADEEARERPQWRRRISAEDPAHAATFCPDGNCAKYVGAASLVPKHIAAEHPNMVGPEKTVRKGKAANLDDDRLLGRREYLVRHMGEGKTGNSDDSRHGFSIKAGELGQVEDVLGDRGLLTDAQRRSLSPRQFGGG